MQADAGDAYRCACAFAVDLLAHMLPFCYLLSSHPSYHLLLLLRRCRSRRTALQPRWTRQRRSCASPQAQAASPALHQHQALAQARHPPLQLV